MATAKPEAPEMTVTLDQKQIAEFQRSAPRIMTQAQDLEILTAEDYEASAAFLDLVASRQKKITDFFEKPAKEANNLHKFITGLRNTLVTPYQQAENLIKSRRRDYRVEEERKRQALEDEARKKAKAEQEAQALEEAKSLVDLGEHEAAEIVLDRAVMAPPPPVIVPSSVPKQTGHSIRKVWKYRVKNADLHKREFLILDESKVGVIVSRLGDDAAAIVGGIEVYEEEVESIRRR